MKKRVGWRSQSISKREESMRKEKICQKYQNLLREEKINQ
jgi:hypothetical protein